MGACMDRKVPWCRLIWMLPGWVFPTFVWRTVQAVAQAECLRAIFHLVAWPPPCFTIVRRPETLTASAVKKGLLQRRSPRYIAINSLGRALDLAHWTEKSTESILAFTRWPGLLSISRVPTASDLTQ